MLSLYNLFVGLVACLILTGGAIAAPAKDIGGVFTTVTWTMTETTTISGVLTTVTPTETFTGIQPIIPVPFHPTTSVGLDGRVSGVPWPKEPVPIHKTTFDSVYYSVPHSHTHSHTRSHSSSTTSTEAGSYTFFPTSKTTTTKTLRHTLTDILPTNLPTGLPSSGPNGDHANADLDARGIPIHLTPIHPIVPTTGGPGYTVPTSPNGPGSHASPTSATGPGSYTFPASHTSLPQTMKTIEPWSSVSDDLPHPTTNTALPTNWHHSDPRPHHGGHHTHSGHKTQTQFTTEGVDATARAEQKTVSWNA